MEIWRFSPPSDPVVTRFLGNPGSSQHMLCLLLGRAWISFSMNGFEDVERKKMNLWNIMMWFITSLLIAGSLLSFAKCVTPIPVHSPLSHHCVTSCRLLQGFLANMEYPMGLLFLLRMSLDVGKPHKLQHLISSLSQLLLLSSSL